MDDVTKLVQAYENSNILLKGVTKQFKTKQRNKDVDI